MTPFELAAARSIALTVQVIDEMPHPAGSIEAFLRNAPCLTSGVEESFEWLLDLRAAADISNIGQATLALREIAKTLQLEGYGIHSKSVLDARKSLVQTVSALRSLRDGVTV